LDALETKLSDNTISIASLKESLWTLSNISAGTHDQIKVILNHTNIVNLIYQYMNSESTTVSREAILIITNAISTAQIEEITYHLANHNNYYLLGIFAKALENDDFNLIQEILEALDHILALDNSTPLYENE